MKAVLLGVMVGLGCLGAPGFAQVEGAKPGPKERHEALEREIREVFEKWSADMSAKASEEARKGKEVPAIPMVPPIKEHVRKFLEAAKDYRGTEDAVPFLMSVVRYGAAAETEAAKKAITTLVAEHRDSPKLTELAEFLPGMARLFSEEFVKSCLATLEHESKNADVRGSATLARAGAVVSNESIAVGSPEYEKCKAELLAVAARAKDESLRIRIGGVIAGREKLAVGLVAPDISGEDLDGAAFRLSDYRGKVVMLDFWGDW